MKSCAVVARLAVVVTLIGGASACGAGSRAGTVASAAMTATCNPSGSSSLTGFTTSARKAVFTWETSGSPATFEFSRIGTTTTLETQTPKDAQNLSAVVFDKAGRELGTVFTECGELVIDPPFPPATDVAVTIEDQNLLNPTTVPTPTGVDVTIGLGCEAPSSLTPPTIVADPNSRTFLIVGSEGTWNSSAECGVVVKTLQWERNSDGTWQLFGYETFANTFCGNVTYRLRVSASNDGGTTEVVSAAVPGRC